MDVHTAYDAVQRGLRDTLQEPAGDMRRRELEHIDELVNAGLVEVLAADLAKIRHELIRPIDEIESGGEAEDAARVAFGALAGAGMRVGSAADQAARDKEPQELREQVAFENSVVAGTR